MYKIELKNFKRLIITTLILGVSWFFFTIFNVVLDVGCCTIEEPTLGDYIFDVLGKYVSIYAKYLKLLFVVAIITTIIYKIILICYKKKIDK